MYNLTPEDSIFSIPPVADGDIFNSTPREGSVSLQPPTPYWVSRDSFAPSADAPLVPKPERGYENGLGGNNATDRPERRKPRFRGPIIYFAVVAIAVLVVLSVVLPVYFAGIKHNTSSGRNGNPNESHTPAPTSNPENPKELTTGGDGSTVTMENGTQFTYHNQFGGFWVWDPQHPFNNNAQPNSWTPPLNTTWKWGVNQLYGVDIGGWFVLEPFISPSLFQRYADAGAVDEWTISTLMAADRANGGLGQLEQHYDTFITEIDFAEIAGAGLNWIRLPIPWWAIDIWEGEPFLPRTCWKYILRAFQWARKYGLRVTLDLHTAPGSQSGFNHSGKEKVFNFLNGPMGLANAQRMVNYIRIFAEFISQPEYANVVPMFGIINEPLVEAIGINTMMSFNLEVYRVIRQITGIGEGKGPYIALSDGLDGLNNWAGLMPNADRVAIDTHPYFAFSGQPNTDPINVPAPDGQMGGIWPGRACSSWKDMVTTSQTSFGVTVAGEYSNAINDCGFYMRSVEPYTTANPDCPFWDDWGNWDQAIKDGLLNFALASMDALENPFFWTWKIGPVLNGSVRAPLWSYKLGLENGWMPKDPRKSRGKCAALGVTNQFNGTYLPWQTGGDGAGSIPTSISASYPWPPSTISNAGGPPSVLPQYTPTGSISTLPPPTFTATKVSLNGWHESSDNVPAPTPIAGCTYPNAWAADTADVAVPIAGCLPGGT